jgi:hypothetical protein
VEGSGTADPAAGAMVIEPSPEFTPP